MIQTRNWHLIGGIKENPGCWDDSNGGLIYVSQRADGVIRRQRVPYARGRGGTWTHYTLDPRDTGGISAPVGVTRYRTAQAAVRAQSEAKEE